MGNKTNEICANTVQWSGLKQSGDMNSPVDYSYLSLEIKKRSVLTRAIKYKSEACFGNCFSLSLKTKKR
ncbi:TPA: hypothetical protein ACGO3A_001685, partial [Streptococcus suis]